MKLESLEITDSEEHLLYKALTFYRKDLVRKYLDQSLTKEPITVFDLHDISNTKIVQSKMRKKHE